MQRKSLDAGARADSAALRRCGYNDARGAKRPPDLSDVGAFAPLLCRKESLVPDPIRTCDVEIRVRYAEVDAMGYVHHARYFVYFEIGRTELLRLNGIRYRDLEARQLYYVVARLECRFKAPARYDDLLTLTTSTERLSPVRVDHSYRLRRGESLLAEAHSTLALVGPDGRPTGLPDDIYAALTGSQATDRDGLAPAERVE
ncbi:MAG: acyl-CoA thioesterase [Phycisphaerae bacterium]|jgi:acyl-CoA thioester hydrolase|nr:acyl-CoA thioesterase [Phycisphaerae bacterium]